MACQPTQDDYSVVDRDSCMPIPLLAAKGIDMTSVIWQDDRGLLFTSMLRSQSNHLRHFAKRCNNSECPDLRMRPTADRFPQQRGCGRISLGRRIKGWEGWEVTWCRKRRDGAGWCRWIGECFDACFSSISSAYDQSCDGTLYEIESTKTIALQ